MSTLNELQAFYKTLSTTELLRILHNAEQYQPQAIEATKNELSNRQLSETEIEEAKRPLFQEIERKVQQKEKISKAKNKVRSILDSLIPHYDKPQKLINIITIAFTGILIYVIISQYEKLFSLASSMPYDFYENMLYLSPFLLLAIGTIAFWKRKKMGWLLLAFFTSYTILIQIATTIGLFASIGRSGQGSEIMYLLTRYFPSIILYALFMSVLLYAIGAKGVRDIYNITPRLFAVAIIAAVLFTIFPYFT